MRQVRPPVVTRKSINFNLLVAYAVALIVALLAAGIVTGVKIVKAKNAKEKPETAKAAPEKTDN